MMSPPSVLAGKLLKHFLGHGMMGLNFEKPSKHFLRLPPVAIGYVGLGEI